MCHWQALLLIGVIKLSFTFLLLSCAGPEVHPRAPTVGLCCFHPPVTVVAIFLSCSLIAAGAHRPLFKKCSPHVLSKRAPALRPALSINPVVHQLRLLLLVSQLLPRQ